MKSIKSVLVAMLLGIMAIQMAWAETQEEKENLRIKSTRLVEAAERGNLDDVKLHLSRGADINAKVPFSGRYEEYTALARAAMNGYFDIVKYLIEKGADVNAKSSEYGETALMMAPSLEIVKYLISKGADINATDKYGNNALMKHLGGYPEDLDVVKALVGGKGGFLSLFKKSNGVDVNAKNNYGKTALMYAESLDIIKYLLSKGADINAKDNEGKTALMYAESLDIIKYLLSKGADINAKDNEGKSVFDYARSGEIAEFLISKGAKR